MFGCCVAGRLLQTNLEQVDETHVVFQLENSTSINHICVFLLGTVPFPPGYGATVHFHWPGKGFQLLGMSMQLIATRVLNLTVCFLNYRLSNEKPSAIFRLRGTYTPTTANGAFDSGMSMSPDSTDVVSVLGLSIEPLSDIELQLATLPAALVKPRPDLSQDPTLMAEKIVKNLFNYVSGFAGGNGSVSPQFSIPMGLIAKWYEIFMSKVRNGGIGFLERED